MDARRRDLHLPPPRTIEQARSVMSDTPHTPVDEAAETLQESLGAVEEAVTEAVEEVHGEVQEPVAEAADTASEAATDAAEEVEETVAEVIDNSPRLTDEHYSEIYNRVLNRLRDEGHITAAVAEEMAGDTEHVTEAAIEAPEVVADRARDTIAPVQEHFWYRPRKFLGRSF